MARSATRLQAPRYERRLILFIDFLGFKEVVGQTERDPDALRRLIAALDDVGRIGEAALFRSQRVTQFSDSVVLSYRVTEPSGVFWMLNSIALTVISLAERGFLLRGAVTVGQLHHTRRHVIGPAMVRAYEMESTEARYPRVIVDRPSFRWLDVAATRTTRPTTRRSMSAHSWPRTMTVVCSSTTYRGSQWSPSPAGTMTATQTT